MWPFSAFSRYRLDRKAKRVCKIIAQEKRERERLLYIKSIEDRVAEDNKQFKLQQGKNK